MHYREFRIFPSFLDSDFGGRGTREEEEEHYRNQNTSRDTSDN